MLPFTKVLSELPNAIRPFERQGLFILPINKKSGLRKQEIRKWIKTNIIPKVKKERKAFIKKLPNELKKKIDKFSYKYIAFILKKNSIDYDCENRKFNTAFLEFIIKSQSKRTIANITTNLEGFIKGKEIFSLIEWDAFIENLNKEQTTLINRYKLKLIKKFRKKKIKGIIDLSTIPIELISEILINVIGEETTPIKSKNLAKKIISGSIETVRILRDSGAMI